MINDIKTQPNEFEIVTPETKNQEVTAVKLATKENRVSENTTAKSDSPAEEKSDKKAEHKTGFAVEEPGKANEEKHKREDKAGRIERDDARDHKTQDAKWQEDKMNEANNQQGDEKEAEDKAGITGDKNAKAEIAREKREDSILFKPENKRYVVETSDEQEGTIKNISNTYSWEDDKKSSGSPADHGDNSADDIDSGRNTKIYTRY